MEIGHFYFLDESYYQDFPDEDIQKNHETINWQLHDKPCFCAVGGQAEGIFWLVPISSKTIKYRKIEAQKISRYKKCDTIKFGMVLGYERAFLLQNMIPATDSYISAEYINQGNPVRVDGAFERELINAASDVLAKHRRGIKLIFPDIDAIENKLINR